MWLALVGPQVLDAIGPTVSKRNRSRFEGGTSDGAGILIFLSLGYPALSFAVQIPLPEPSICLLIPSLGLCQGSSDLLHGDFWRNGPPGSAVPQIAIVLYQLARVLHFCNA